MRCVVRPQTLHACCSVMTVILATTRTAWTPHCSPCPKAAGSASGKETQDLQRGLGLRCQSGCDVEYMTGTGFRRLGCSLASQATLGCLG